MGKVDLKKELKHLYQASVKAVVQVVEGDHQTTNAILVKMAFIPKGYRTVIPYLSINGVARAVAFYKKAFAQKKSCVCQGGAG